MNQLHTLIFKLKLRILASLTGFVVFSMTYPALETIKWWKHLWSYLILVILAVLMIYQYFKLINQISKICVEKRNNKAGENTDNKQFISS